MLYNIIKHLKEQDLVSLGRVKKCINSILYVYICQLEEGGGGNMGL